MSNTPEDDNSRMPVMVYLSKSEREYLNEQAQKKNMRRGMLIYMLLSTSTNGFTRDVRFAQVEEAVAQ